MKTKNMILVTGGAGFIGSHTADALAARGYAVRILDNLQREVHGGRWPKYVLGKGYELLRGDVRDRAAWKRALRPGSGQGVSAVFHLAAYQDQRLDFGTFFETNTMGTALLYETIVGMKLSVRKVILASSQFVYGDGEYRCVHPRGGIFYPELRTQEQFERKEWDIKCPHGRSARFVPFREDQQPTPTNPYGLSKVALEQLGFRLGKTYGIPTTALRYSIVQGARQSPKNLYSGALRIFVTQALAGKPITVTEDGHQVRDFVNVADVVRANLLALTNRKTDFEIYNVGGGKAYRVFDFAKRVKALAGSSSPIVMGGYRRTDSRHAVSGISKLKKFGWRPRHDIDDSIREYIAWYKAEYLDRKG